MKFTNPVKCQTNVYTRIAPMFCLILFIGTFVTYSLISQVKAENTSNYTENKELNLTFNHFAYPNDQSNSNKTQNSELYGPLDKCQGEIAVDESSFQYNKKNLECVTGLINACNSNDDVYLLYITGSMYLKILGLKNEYCHMDILHEIERDSNSYTCLIPISKLDVWNSWKNGDGLDVLGNVTNYCSQK